MKKIIFTALLIAGTYFISNAQDMGSSYKTAVGVKFYPGALSIKSFIQPNKALEGLAYFYSDGFRVTGLYEIHGDIEGVEGLKWYVGPGAHVGFWSDSWKAKYPDRNNSIAIGIDGVLGLDYKITGAPINVSLDWQPSFNFVGYNYFEGGWGGLGIRYTF
jgi:hypothetical protein